MENIIPIAHTRIISTHALTEGDALVREFSIVHDISTHALTEGDAPGLCLHIPPAHFNSRPHGGRLFCVSIQIHLFFISTHALTEGDVCKVGRVRNFLGISTHALTEGDSIGTSVASAIVDFNSRPHGGRRDFSQEYRHWDVISTHALTEGDLTAVRTVVLSLISTHALTEGDAYLQFLSESLPHFNSRPHGGRPTFCRVHCSVSGISTHALTEGDRESVFSFYPILSISTHALTEGDGKFRQIFLLNRGYAYSISLYFLPHFISLLPQILSFQQKSFKFQVRIFLLFSVHLAFALQNQCVHHVKYRFCTNMFYFVFVLFTQIVKPQTIGLFIYDFF